MHKAIALHDSPMGDLFGLRSRISRRVMMHAIDTGQAPGTMPGWRTTKGVHFLCQGCGYDAGWLFDMQDGEVRRWLPCPKCNEDAHG